MHPAFLPSALVFAFALAVAAHVAMQRDRGAVHWLLMGNLLALATWSLGTMLRFSVSTQPGLDAAMRVVFLGVFTSPPFWLVLAARYARLPVAERRAFTPLVFTPSALVYLALLTNEAHGWVIHDVSFEALRAGGVAWAGPLFWGFLVWAWLCVIGGAAVYVAMARRMLGSEERRRGWLLVLASAFPLAASPIYMFQLLPVRFDLTPSALLLTLVFMATTIFRYRLLRSLPVARRDVIESLEDGVVMASPAGLILDLNPASERVLGCDARALHRRLMTDVLVDLVPEERKPALREALDQLATRGEPVSMEIRTVDDRRIALTADRTIHGGAVAGLFAVLRDRTDERRFERLLRRTQRLQTAGTLAAGIAHEVNNPLAYIRANLGEIHRMGELVERSQDDPDAKLAGELADLRQIAEETLDGIARIERIVGDMRRLSTGPEPLARRAVDLNAVVRDAVRLANLHRRQAVEVRLLLAEDLPAVMGSSERLVQAVLNLLLNARQAVEKVQRPRISVFTALDGRRVEIRVTDNGPGVPYEIQERIFDPFFTTKGPDRGTGLGLSISYDIAREHGGELEVRSHPKGGAAFVMRLPMAGDEPGP